MNVLEVGPSGASSDQYIKVKYGAADSGLYNFLVRARNYGNFDTTGVTLTAVGKVTGFSPKQGSIHGGTLVTIDGYHFSTVATDNPIRMGYTDCLVESTSTTQIKCRTVARHEGTTGEDDLVVFLRTFEEAVCDVVGGCKFTWTDSSFVTSFDVSYDSSL